jgi:hypothetical protein
MRTPRHGLDRPRRAPGRPVAASAGMSIFRRALVTVMLATSACSYTFTIGPHQRSLGGTPATCTTSRVPPIMDTVIAVASGLAAAAAFYGCQSSGADDDDSGCIRAILLGPPAAASALVFGLSAASGFRDTSGCAEEAAVQTAAAR